MSKEACPYLGNLNGNPCKSTKAIRAIIESGNGCGLSATDLYEVYCHGIPSGCPAYDSIRVEGHSSPWRK
jgi:hypothetical protein